MTETWLSVAGYEGIYEVSSLGRVRSLPRIDARGNSRVGRTLSPETTAAGYLRVVLCRGAETQKFAVHRLVAQAFLAPADGPHVNHKNGIKCDPRADNLEWITPSGNTQHALTVLGAKYGRGMREIVARKADIELRFSSAREAERAGFYRHKVRACLTGRARTYNGYSWSFAA